MRTGTRGRLFSAVGALTWLFACAPPVPAVPCNADDECAPDEACLRGVCTESSALSPPRDGGGDPPADAHDPVPDDGGLELDGGPSTDDAGASDGGDVDASVPSDGGQGGDDAGEPSEGGPFVDGGILVDGGIEPGLDAGAPGILSFTASPSTVTLGGSVTLSWESRGLAACVVEGTDEIIGVNGSLVVERPGTRPYLLRCVDADGERHEAEVIVAVDCPTVVTLGSITILSDAAFATLPTGACIDVTGSVEVRGITSTSLTALYGLRRVGGDLSIGGAPHLKRLDGLEMLHEVGGDLRLGYEIGTAAHPLPALESVHGLSALASIGADLELLSVTSLTSLAGLERLRIVGDDFDIREAPVLTDLLALRRLEGIGGVLEIEHAASLSKLGMPSLASIGGLWFYDLPELVDLRPLSRVTGTLTSLFLADCNSLENLEGLEGVTGVNGPLQVQRNPRLLSLDGLSGIEHARKVVIRRNDRLASADLPSLISINSVTSVGCSSEHCDGDLFIERNPRLENLDGFGALKTVSHNLTIIRNAELARVKGFARLDFVGNDFIIRQNEKLVGVEGFDVLSKVDDIFVEDNPLLEVLRLPSLTRVHDDVVIVGNPSLPTLAGVERLERIGGDLVIENNARLGELGDAPIESVGDYPTCSYGCLLHVRNNPHLPMSFVYQLLTAVQRPVDGADAANIDVSGNGT